jgi:hypothetical protein
MAYKCQLCNTETVIQEDMNFFDIKGEPTPGNSPAVVAVVCTPCLDATEEYDNYANISYRWNALTTEQQKEIWPYIKETSKYSLWFEVFNSASEVFCGDSFESWLEAVDSEFNEWVK